MKKENSAIGSKVSPRLWPKKEALKSPQDLLEEERGKIFWCARACVCIYVCIKHAALQPKWLDANK